eukprot:SAG11_NODE_48_length_20030_cov_232.459084_1_plen_209_part_00
MFFNDCDCAFYVTVNDTIKQAAAERAGYTTFAEYQVAARDAKSRKEGFADYSEQLSFLARQRRLKNNTGAGGSGAGAKYVGTEEQCVNYAKTKMELRQLLKELKTYGIDVPTHLIRKDQVIKLCEHAGLSQAMSARPRTGRNSWKTIELLKLLLHNAKKRGGGGGGGGGPFLQPPQPQRLRQPQLTHYITYVQPQPPQPPVRSERQEQ